MVLFNEVLVFAQIRFVVCRVQLPVDEGIACWRQFVQVIVRDGTRQPRFAYYRVRNLIREETAYTIPLPVSTLAAYRPAILTIS